MKTIKLEKLLIKPYTAQYTIRGDIGESSTEFFINLFRSVLRKPSIRNVVLFINSSGGDAAAGQIAYNILCKMKKHVTVYTVRGDIGESSTEFFINLFRSVLRKPSIRNVVLFINSNGGDAAAGQIAYNILCKICLLYTSPSPRDRQKSRMPSSA